MKLSPASIKRREAKKSAELRKLRELVHFLLVGKTCHFCRKPLSLTAEEFTSHGNSRGPEFTDSITIHHVDGNHGNDSRNNKALSHRTCHKSYHMTLQHEIKRRSNLGL